MRDRLQFLFNRHSKEKQQPNFLCVQKIKEHGRTIYASECRQTFETWDKKRKHVNQLSPTMILMCVIQFRGMKCEPCRAWKVKPFSPMFLKLWSADRKWSSGSARVVLLDWTLVQKRQKKSNLRELRILHKYRNRLDVCADLRLKRTSIHPNT
jgi:hypothetical protein